MDINEIIAKLKTEADGHTPDLCEKIISSAQGKGLLTATPATAGGSGAAKGLSASAAKGIKLGAIVLSATIAAGLAIGLPVGLTSKGGSNSAGTGQTPPGDTSTTKPPVTDPKPTTPTGPTTPTPHEHVYGEWKVVMPASCTEDGEKERSCGCGETQKDTIPAAHSYGEELTYDADGHWAVCSECGEAGETVSHTYDNAGACYDCESSLEMSEGLTFTLNSDGKSYMVTTGPAIVNLVIPAEYEGHPVTKINSQAFCNRPELETVAIPASVGYIDKLAFASCLNLKSVIIYGGEQAARARSAEVVERVICDEAFAWCEALEKVVLPQGITSIGKNAFYACRSLTTIDIPDSVSEIKDFAFCVSGLKSVKLPKNLKTLSNGVFEGCSALEEVILNDGLEVLDGYAMSGTSVKKLHIPASLVDIREGALFNLRLDDLTVDAGNTVFKVDGNCLIETATKTLLLAASNPVIPTDGSVTKIADYAFYGNQTIGAIVIPNCVTEIGASVFSQSSLTSIVIPEGITALGTGMFDNCKQLTEVTLPSTVKSFAYMTFGYCYALETVNFGGTLSEFSAISKDKFWKASASASNPVKFTVIALNGSTTIS